MDLDYANSLTLGIHIPLFKGSTYLIKVMIYCNEFVCQTYFYL